MKSLVYCFFIPMIVIGCAGNCIKVGGSYQGIEGEITYCFNAEKTASVEMPVMDSSEGEELIGLSLNEIDKLLTDIEKAEYKKAETPTARSLALSLPGSDIYARLKYHLKHK